VRAELLALDDQFARLAVAFDLQHELAVDALGTLQRRHASLCEQQGPAICQIIGMTKSGEDEGEVTGRLEMAVASRQARAFGALLEDEAQDAGAEQVAAEIASDELSKQLVDTEARLRARTQLRDRLQEVLRTRKGSVEELVEAERSVAAVNEEIDQARSWLKEMEGRVAYSRMTVNYETGTPVTRDFLGPVTGALGSLGSIFGYLAAFLIVVGAVVLPIGGVTWLARRLNRLGKPQDGATSA
jgi:multidrug efflux pump subunit AcrA (membrane-fusion protein)